MSTVYVPVFCDCGHEDDCDAADLARGLRLICPDCGEVITTDEDDTGPCD